MLLSARAGAAQRVVPAAGVGGDGQQRRCRDWRSARAGGQVDVALVRMVSARCSAPRIGRVVEQGVHGLVAFQVDDAEYLSLHHHAHPRLPRRADFIHYRRVG